MEQNIKNMKTKKWNVSLKVNPEEEKQNTIRAIKMGLGVGDYIKQAALEDLPISKYQNEGKFS